MTRPKSSEPKSKTRPLPEGTVNITLNVPEEFRGQLDAAAADSDGVSRNEYMARALEIALRRKWRFKRGALSLINDCGEVETQERPRDVREVSFYEDDTIEAGRSTGSVSGNPPGKIEVPSDWNLPVDFVVKVHGDSMSGFIEDGELAAFTHATTAPNGQVVAALVEGQMMIKLFNDPGNGVPELHSINPDYPPIRCTKHVRVQGLYQGKFPLPAAPKRALPKK